MTSHTTRSLCSHLVHFTIHRYCYQA